MAAAPSKRCRVESEPTRQLASVPSSSLENKTREDRVKALGRWFEELDVGTVIEHALTRTVTEADNVLFTSMTMNVQPLHLDAQFAATTEFSKPLVNSMFTLGLVVGITVLELTHGTLIANMAMTDVVFPAPVFAGDTVHVVSRVMTARASKSRPDAGIVEVEHIATNQRDEVVCRLVRTMLMNRRPQS
jgi:acyl dehydratase